MSKFTRFIIRHKFAVINILFSLIAGFVPIHVFDGFASQKDVFFILATTLLAGIFMEIGAIHYKAAFIYSREEIREVKLPLWLTISFIPRVVVSFLAITVIVKGLGWLSESDMVLLILIAFAFGFEFWVRASLMNPEYGEENSVNIPRVWAGEIFHLFFLLIYYFSVWKVLLLDSGQVLGKMRFTQNYPWLAVLFLLLFATMQLPHIVEEYFKPKGHRGRISSIFSFVFPVLVFIIHMLEAKARLK